MNRSPQESKQPEIRAAAAAAKPRRKPPFPEHIRRLMARRAMAQSGTVPQIRSIRAQDNRDVPYQPPARSRDPTNQSEGNRAGWGKRTGGEGPGEGGDPEVCGGAGRPQQPGGGDHGHDPEAGGGRGEERDWLLGAAASALSRRVRSARWCELVASFRLFLRKFAKI